MCLTGCRRHSWQKNASHKGLQKNWEIGESLILISVCRAVHSTHDLSRRKEGRGGIEFPPTEEKTNPDCQVKAAIEGGRADPVAMIAIESFPEIRSPLSPGGHTRKCPKFRTKNKLRVSFFV